MAEEHVAEFTQADLDDLAARFLEVTSKQLHQATRGSAALVLDLFADTLTKMEVTSSSAEAQVGAEWMQQQAASAARQVAEKLRAESPELMSS